MPFPGDPLFYAAGFAATFVMAMAKGAFGGGLAIIGIPILALAAPPLDAAIIVAPLITFMDVFAVGAFGPKHWSIPDLKWLLPALVVGIGLGWLMFVAVDSRWVTLVISVVTLGFTAHYFLKGRSAPPANAPTSPPLAIAAGLASGFTTFVAHAGGPPIAMYLLRRGLDKTKFAATNVAVFMAGNLVKLIPYAILGLSRPHALWAALALSPIVPVGVYAGRALHDRLTRETLFFWCYLFLGLAALKLFIDTVRALMV
jgi:uncharacterized membrane protein YfcA